MLISNFSARIHGLAANKVALSLARETSSSPLQGVCSDEVRLRESIGQRVTIYRFNSTSPEKVIDGTLSAVNLNDQTPNILLSNPTYNHRNPMLSQYYESSTASLTLPKNGIFILERAA